MQQFYILVLVFCVSCITLANSMPVINSHGLIIKRQGAADTLSLDPAVLVNAIVETTAETATAAAPITVIASTPVADANNEVVEANHEEILGGDATGCGKKIQSEKPSDPAGEFLKCYMPDKF